jgi:NCAIR mutase (PurE)-related protein
MKAYGSQSGLSAFCYYNRSGQGKEKDMKTEIRELLNKVESGEISAQEALLKIKKQPFEDLGYAKVDLHRGIRQGAAEVVYGAGKTVEQMEGIIGSMLGNGIETVLVTRITQQEADALSEKFEIEYNKDARAGVIGRIPAPDGIGKIVVATGGTSDIPVAEEAALTAEVHGNEVIRLYDVGVAGLHRLLSHIDEIMSASVIIAIAGMEGALASVIGGLADCPVIAVPTSVGYGASFEGLSALLSMLNSCASGVSVVNIDNGFGAGYLAGMINHMEAKK